MSVACTIALVIMIIVALRELNFQIAAVALPVVVLVFDIELCVWSVVKDDRK
jgi:hypothetical protein